MSKFNVGDMVRVRDWEDMVEEFGISKDAMDIPCDAVFVYSMKDFCGEVYTITSAFEGNGGHDAYYLEGCGDEKVKWEFSNDMLRLVRRAEGTIEPVQASVLFAFSDAGVEVEEFVVTNKDDSAYEYTIDDKEKMIQALADYLGIEISFLTMDWSVGYEMVDVPLEVIDEEKVEPYNGMVVCLKEDIGLTAGKIYNIVDGVFIDDEGDKRPTIGTIVNKDDRWFTEGWLIPLVEG